MVPTKKFQRIDGVGCN
jgi:hypothetical protein